MKTLILMGVITTLLSVVATLLLLLSPTDPRPSDAFITKVDELATWVHKNSDFAPMEKHPAYLFVTQEELNYLYYQDTPSGYTGEASQDGIHAIYSNGIMFLNENFNLEDDVNIFTLVHEIVHHLHHEQPREYSCAQTEERVAYLLQDKYAKAHNSEKRVNMFWMLAKTQCPHAQ